MPHHLQTGPPIHSIIEPRRKQQARPHEPRLLSPVSGYQLRQERLRACTTPPADERAAKRALAPSRRRLFDEQIGADVTLRLLVVHESKSKDSAIKFQFSVLEDIEYVYKRDEWTDCNVTCRAGVVLIESFDLMIHLIHQSLQLIKSDRSIDLID